MTETPNAPTRITSSFAALATWARRDLPLLAVIVAGFAFWLNGKLTAVNTVRTFWRDDSVVVSSPLGGHVITHLMYNTGDAAASAPLPDSPMLLDSGSIVYDRDALSHLTWKGRDGEIAPPPTKGSRVFVIYHRNTYSEFTNPSKPN